MGNSCQAAEIAAAVVEYPGGRVERVQWMELQLPVSAQRLMADYPGHFVALISSNHLLHPASAAHAPPANCPSTSTTATHQDQLIKYPRTASSNIAGSVPSFKLLAADAPLRRGHRYRLLSFEEVLTCFSQGGGTYVNLTRPHDVPAAMNPPTKQAYHHHHHLREGRVHSHNNHGVKIGC